MSMKTRYLDSKLPKDDEVLAQLMNAKASGLGPVAHIGGGLQKAVQFRREISPFIIARYPNTLAWLQDPANLKWLQDGLQETITYLKQMSDYLNSPAGKEQMRW